MKAHSYRYRVIDYRVVDGDTVELTVDLGFRASMRQVFRLARINAPELEAQSVSTLPGWAARIALTNLLDRATITVESIKTEKYGRWLAELWAGAVNVNDWLLAEGYANRYPPTPNP